MTRGRALSAALALLVAVGARVALLADKPFWRDEASLALAAEGSLAAFVEERWAVPVGFLLLVKATVPLAALTPPEVAYRLVPLAAGIALVALLPLLARRLGLAAPAPLVVSWIGAGLPGLVYYSRELKPYGLDALLAVVVASLAYPAVVATGRPRPRPALLATLAAAPWLSFGVVFPAFAILGWALWTQRRDRERRWYWAAALLVFVASLGVVYATVMHRQVATPRLLETWSGEVRSGLPTARAAVEAAVEPHATAFTYVFPGAWAVGLFLVLVGAAAARGPGRALLLWMWIGSAAGATVAALGGVYLLTQGRLLLFLAPPLVLLAGAGLVRVAAAIPSSRPWAPVTLAAVAGIAWTGEALVHRLSATRTDPRRFFLHDVLQDVAPIIERLDRQHVPSSSVLVTQYAGYPFRYYRRGRLPAATVCTMAECRDEPRVIAEWLERLRGPGWMVLTDQEAGADRLLLSRLGFQVRDEWEARGMRAWQVVRQRR